MHKRPIKRCRIDVLLAFISETIPRKIADLLQHPVVPLLYRPTLRREVL